MRQSELLVTKLKGLRQRSTEIKKEVCLYKQKEKEFIAELDRHMQGVERNEQERLARIEALDDEQEQLRFHSNQQDLEQETLRLQQDEMMAQHQSCESRVQFLMDHLVNLLSRGSASDGNKAMLATILADAEERDQLSQMRLQLFTRQLEEARQENRIRAQTLSDRQCQTTALHERLCKLQNEIFNGARAGLLSSSLGGPAGSSASLGGSEVPHVPDSVTDTTSTATTAATSGGNLASGQGFTESTSRLMAKAAADLAAVEKLSEVEQVDVAAYQGMPVEETPPLIRQVLPQASCPAVASEASPDHVASAERIVLESPTFTDADGAAEAADGEEVPFEVAIQAEESTTTVHPEHQFADNAGERDAIAVIKTSSPGSTPVMHVELPGKGPLVLMGNGASHDAELLGVTAPTGGLLAMAVAAASSTAPAAAPGWPRLQGAKASCAPAPSFSASTRRESRGSGGTDQRHQERPSVERAERRPPVTQQEVASTGVSVSTTAGSAAGSTAIAETDGFAAAAPSAASTAPLVARRTSGPRSVIKASAVVSASGGRSGASSPVTVHVVTTQAPYARSQASSIDVPLRSRSTRSPSAVRSGSPAGTMIVTSDGRAAASSSLGHSDDAQSIPQVGMGRTEYARPREQRTARRASRREPPRPPQTQFSTPIVRRLSLAASRDSNTVPNLSPRKAVLELPSSLSAPSGHVSPATLRGFSPPPGAPLVATPVEPLRAHADPSRALSAPPLPSSACATPLTSLIPAVISVASSVGVDGLATPAARRLSPARGISTSRSPSPGTPHALPSSTVAAGCSVETVAAPTTVHRRALSPGPAHEASTIATGMSFTPRYASPSSSCWPASRPIATSVHPGLVAPRGVPAATMPTMMVSTAVASTTTGRCSSPSPASSSGLFSGSSGISVTAFGSGSHRAWPGGVGAAASCSGTRRAANSVTAAAPAWTGGGERVRMSSGSPGRSEALAQQARVSLVGGDGQTGPGVAFSATM